MSQTPNPQDPYGTEPSGSTPPPPAQQAFPDDAPQPPAPQGEMPSGDVPAPTSDPALHPHDPYAYDPSAPQQQASAPGAQGPADPFAQATQEPAYGQPEQPLPGQDSSAPHSAGGYDPGAPHGGGPAFAGQQSPYAQQSPYVQGTTGGPTAPPAGLKGVHDGPLSGQPVSESDSRMWSLFAHLSAVVGYVVGVGFLGWLGPLIIFLVYKDRDRFVRFNAAEALNAAIAVVIASIVLWIGIAIIGVITLGLGFVLTPIAYVPAVVHGVFAIIGAIRSNQGTWWNYPVNLRMFS